jgi:membrane-associated protease RseP (regulator of RpoE activity)
MTDYVSYSTYASDPAAQLRAAVSDVFQVEDTTFADGADGVVRFRGRFFADPERAYAHVRARFRELGYTPFFGQQNGHQEIVAAPGVVQVRPSRVWINVVLFIATVISVWLSGADLDAPTLGERILSGVPYAAALIGILLAHELGHYFMARYHGVAVTLPYFIPMPFLFLGTMGAFIRMKEPMPNRKVVFDIGVAGPLAGLVVAIPLLVYGLSQSVVEPLSESLSPGSLVSLEGNSLLYLGLKYLVHGRMLPDICPPAAGALDCLGRLMFGGTVPSSALDVKLHPVAFAGWVGLLVTAINLLPASQLDGGHVIYTLLGRRARYLSLAVTLFLVLLSAMLYITRGIEGLNWIVMAGLIYLVGWQHPPSLNELVQLDTKRRLLAVSMLILFLLMFVPIPLRILG